MRSFDHRGDAAQLLEQRYLKHFEVDEGVQQCKLSGCHDSDGDNVNAVLRCQRLELTHELAVEDGAPYSRRVAFHVALLDPSRLNSF